LLSLRMKWSHASTIDIVSRNMSTRLMARAIPSRA